MLTSKDLIDQTGMSRATLNNYIAQGLLPKPDVRPTISGGRATRIGFFPASVLKTIEEINTLKREGLSMSEITDKLSFAATTAQTVNAAPTRTTHAHAAETEDKYADPTLPGGVTSIQMGGDGMRLTLDQIEHPAYLVNPMFELEWHNDAARDLVLGHEANLSSDIQERNLFGLLMDGDAAIQGSAGMDDVLGFHLSVAKNRVSRRQLLSLDADLDDEQLDTLVTMYDDAQPQSPGRVVHAQVNLGQASVSDKWFNVYVSFFREGIFFAYSPMESHEDELMALLARRDIVIKDLLKKRRPYLTPLAVLVADLQGSVKICAELPPEEYFELINDIWGAMEPKLRKYYATHGKHVGDGMVYYFFPQPDCNYVLNAVRCAQEMKDVMKEISRTWKKRKNWLNDLQLNIGLVEGQEWFGTYQTPTHIEFTVLGDTINQAGRLSDFAQGGSVWVTKAMLSQVPAKDRGAISYGIRRKDEHGAEMLIPETFSRIANLVDLDNAKYEKFRDIAVLPVTEVLDVDPPKS